jgi:hypothetical protein
MDVCTQVPQQDNACRLIVLQYHLILGTMRDRRLDLLYGSQDTLLAYLVAEVIPTLRTVSRDTTATYCHRLREGVESGSCQASAVVHRIWPDDGSPPDKRVKLDGTITYIQLNKSIHVLISMNCKRRRRYVRMLNIIR